MYEVSTPFKKILYTAPKILYFATFIILAYLYANVRNRDPTFDSPETRILQTIFTNLHAFPINSIQLAAAGVCPTGTETIQFGAWSGISVGCLCSGSVILNRTCTTTDVGCESISAVPSQSISTWRRDVFCVQRLTKFTYPTSVGTCDADQTSCAAKVCVDTGTACPLTDIKIISSTATVPTSYTALPLTDTTRQMIYTSSIVDEPIVDIKVSLYDEPCMDPQAQPYSKERVPYALSVIPEDGCINGGAIDHLENLDTMTIISLFDENKITSLITRVPSYVIYIGDESAYLVGIRQYTRTTSSGQCGSLDPAIFTDLWDEEDTFYSSTLGLLIASLCLGCGMFLTFMLEYLFRIRDRQKEIKFVKLFAYGNLVLLFGACVLYIIIGSFGIRAKVDMNDNLRYLKVLSKTQCFQQEVVNRTLQAYQENISDLMLIIWLSIVLLILASAGITLILILAAIDGIMARKRAENMGQSYYRNVGQSAKYQPPGVGASIASAAPNKSKTTGNIEMLFKGN